MIDLKELINGLPDLYIRGPVTEDEIIAKEKELDLHFSEDYREYAKEFGFITYDGHELTGITELKNYDVVSITNKARVVNSKIPERYYVIEDTHIDGIIILQSEDGSVYIAEEDKLPRKIYDSLKEYILKVDE